MSTNSQHNHSSIEQTVAQAQAGDAHALDLVLRFCQEPVYNLALRMLWNPSDAEDATQEIVIKILTHLSQFRHASRFSTWVYRIATNHLLTLRQQRAERSDMTFAALRTLRDGTQASEPGVPEHVEDGLRLAEICRQCTLGMLLSLDREQRIAYILGEIFEVSSQEGAHILDLPPATFRKRLSRARLRLRAFMAQRCGLINPSLACRCGGGACHEPGQTKPETEPAQLDQAMNEWQQIYRMAALFRAQPVIAAPESLVVDLKRFLNGTSLTLFQP